MVNDRATRGLLVPLIKLTIEKYKDVYKEIERKKHTK
jgi:hypothetical protein